MANITSEEITNLYLYGQDTTPGDLVDVRLIRPDDTEIFVNQDVVSYMTTGAGRIGTGAQFDLVKNFFARDDITKEYLFKIPPGSYTQPAIAPLVDLTGRYRSITLSSWR